MPPPCPAGKVEQWPQDPAHQGPRHTQGAPPSHSGIFCPHPHPEVVSDLFFLDALLHRPLQGTSTCVNTGDSPAPVVVAKVGLEGHRERET